MYRRLKQSGSAVITALFIMALVAIAVTAMTYRLQIDIKRLQWVSSSQQLQNSLAYVRYWARGNLISNLDSQDDEAGTQILRLPQSMPKQRKNQIQITGLLEDAQGRLNLNNLKNDPKESLLLAKLIALVLPDVPANKNLKLAASITKQLTPPSHSALLMQKNVLPNKQYVSVSELRELPEMTLAHYLKLRPYLIALPETTPYNINSVSLPILQTLFPDVGVEQLQQLLNARNTRHGFNSMEDWQKAAAEQGLTEKQLTNVNLTIQSTYFIVTADAWDDDQHQRSMTIVKRVKNENESAKLEWLWQID